MAGHVMKRMRLANPSRRRMSPAQIAHFGTRRQKAALLRRSRGKQRSALLRSMGKGTGHRRRGRRNQSDFGLGGSGGLITKAEQAAQRAIHSVERAAEDAIGHVTSRLNRKRRNPRYRGRKKRTVSDLKRFSRKVRRALKGGHEAKARYYYGRKRNRGRRQNVGEILTVVPAANPGRRRNRRMARVRNRRRNRRQNYRRHAVANRRYNRRHNRRHNRRRHSPHVVYRNRYRRHRHHNRRRNPTFMTGTTGAIVGVLAGGMVTKVITGFLPSTLMSGWAGYLTTGVTAVVAGQVTGKVLKNPSFGRWVTIGGLLIVALEVVNQYFPQLGLPFGLTSGTSGMGLISSSNFYVPQVNTPGSMASFVTPAGVTAAIPVMPSTGMHGLGGPQFAPGLRTMRRIGRMR